MFHFSFRQSRAIVSAPMHRLQTVIYVSAVNERAEVMLNSIGDAVVGADLAGAITYLNRKAELLTGWTLAEAERWLGPLLNYNPRAVDAA